MLPKLATGDANKVWIIPSELNDALKGLGGNLGEVAGKALAAVDPSKFEAPKKVDVFAEIEASKKAEEAESQASVEQAIAEAQKLEAGKAARLSTGQPNPELTAQREVVDPVADLLPDAQPDPEPWRDEE